MSKEVLRALQVKSDDTDSRHLYEALPAVVKSPLIQTLKKEYVKLEAKSADMSRRYTSRHPSLIALRSNMTALKAQIDVETNKIVQSLKTELSGQLLGRRRVPDTNRSG